MKKLAFLLDWPEGKFVNAAVAAVFEMIDDREGTKAVPKAIFMARQALDHEKRYSSPPAQPLVTKGLDVSL